MDATLYLISIILQQEQALQNWQYTDSPTNSEICYSVCAGPIIIHICDTIHKLKKL